MNKNLYNAAMDKITMSDECLGEILDNIDEIQPELTTKQHKKVRYIRIITALAVFIFGSVTVAAETGSLEWIKNIFAKEVTVTNVYDMVTEIENFRCESDMGVELSPVGILCDEQDFYAVFHADKFPKNLNKEYIGYLIEDGGKYAEEYGGLSYSYTSDFDAEKNYIILKLNMAQRIFKDGENITLRVNYDEHEYNPSKAPEHRDHIILSDLARLSFTLRLGKFDSLNINYKEYMPEFIPKRDYTFLFDEINITPFSLTTIGRMNFYADALLNDGYRIVMTDGTELLSKDWSSSSHGLSDSYSYSTSSSSSGTNAGIVYDTSWVFDEPIDPNNVAELYLGKMLIYRK